jgi:hypothetical protein
MVFGPFVLLPGVLACLAVVFTIATLPSSSDESEPRGLRYGALALSVGTLLVPFALEWLSIVPPSFELRDGTIVLLPRLVSFPPGLTLALLVVMNSLLVVVPALLVMRVRDYALNVERRAFETASRLRQLVPRSTRSAASVEDGAANDH